MKFNFLPKDKISQLPESAGVYVFSAQGGPASGGKEGTRLLYIGKANNIKERVKNHFKQPSYRDELFLEKIKKVGYLETYSEIEALILEAELIKKHRPRFNVLWKDDKNYFYVGITKEDLPRIFITHQPKFKIQTSRSALCCVRTVGNSKGIKKNLKLKINYLGPFVDGVSIKKTLRILRKIFPYYTTKKHPQKPCIYCHLGLCPGPWPDLKEYRNNIKNLIAVLRGRKKTVLIDLKKEMEKAANLEDFEKAKKIRDKVFALERVISHAKVIEAPNVLGEKWENVQKNLQKIVNTTNKIFRIEAYDISNIQGKKATGSMVTFIRGKPDKNLYRKFKIKIAGKPNDVAMIKEILERRFFHQEWQYPDLVLIDGGKPQLSAALNVKRQKGVKNLKIIALAKRKNEFFIEGRKKPILLKKLSREIFNLILQLRDEAHRFAITYHRNLRTRALLN